VFTIKSANIFSILTVKMDGTRVDGSHVKMLAKQIHFDSVKAVFQGITRYGESYDLFISITGPNGKTISGIKTVWQKDTGCDFIRLITVLPAKKKR
jgi:hypothetical protein